MSPALFRRVGSHLVLQGLQCGSSEKGTRTRKSSFAVAHTFFRSITPLPLLLSLPCACLQPESYADESRTASCSVKTIIAAASVYTTCTNWWITMKKSMYLSLTLSPASLSKRPPQPFLAKPHVRNYRHMCYGQLPAAAALLAHWALPRYLSPVKVRTPLPRHPGSAVPEDSPTSPTSIWTWEWI